MSSFRKALPRREHKERSQLISRERFGLLEKKKDYKLRAKDFHRKEDFLQKLKQKARLRNKDEFYFGMINSKTNKGVHLLQRTEKFDKQSQMLMKSQNLNYVRTHHSINVKKLEKLSQQDHIVPENEDTKQNHLIFVDDGALF
jgi:U3 small nucleolar RNA-associated protein 11